MRHRRHKAASSWSANQTHVLDLHGPVRTLNAQALDVTDNRPAKLVQERRNFSHWAAEASHWRVAGALIVGESVACEEHDPRFMVDLIARFSQGVLAREAA